jgi:hypothetical protein
MLAFTSTSPDGTVQAAGATASEVRTVPPAIETGLSSHSKDTTRVGGGPRRYCQERIRREEPAKLMQISSVKRTLRIGGHNKRDYITDENQIMSVF